MRDNKVEDKVIATVDATVDKPKKRKELTLDEQLRKWRATFHQNLGHGWSLYSSRELGSTRRTFFGVWRGTTTHNGEEVPSDKILFGLEHKDFEAKEYGTEPGIRKAIAILTRGKRAKARTRVAAVAVGAHATS